MDVYSPGAVTAERAAFELRVLRGMGSDVARFLRGVHDDAVTAYGAATVLAGGAEPFTLGQVLSRWGPVVDGLMGSLGRAGWAAAQSQFMGRVQRRVRDSELPLAAYEEVKGILAAAVTDPSGRPNRTRLKADLRRVLLPAGRPKDSHLAVQAARIARTETTAVFNHAVEQQLVADGAARKRWKSHHDNRVRPTHSHTDGQTVNVGAPFLVGGWSMMAPGDPAAPHSETAACRCCIVGVRR